MKLLLRLLAPTLLVLAVFTAKPAVGFQLLVDAAGDNFLRWPSGTFSFDNSTITIPNGIAAASTLGAAPNDNLTGLLFLIDNSSGGNNCDATDAYTNSGTDPFDSTFKAMATWSQIASTTVDLQYVCSVDDMGAAAFDSTDDPANLVDIVVGSNFELNGFNEIFFDDSAAGDIFLLFNAPPDAVLAFTVLLDASGGQTYSPPDIAEVFMVVNQTGIIPSSAFDLQATILHELGHALGLDHTASVLNARAVVDPFTVPASSTLLNSTVPASADHVPLMYILDANQGSDLEIDDVGGITALYPAASATTTFGAISGLVLDQFAQPIIGASVIAYDSSGNEIGALVGGNPELTDNDNGSYRIDFVPPGTYTVTLIPIDGTAASAGVILGADIDFGNALFPTTPADFIEQFFDSVMTEGVSTQVTVSAGQETTDVDFTNVLTGSVPGTLGNFIPVVELADQGGCQMASAGDVSNLANLLIFLFPVVWSLHRKRR